MLQNHKPLLQKLYSRSVSLGGLAIAGIGISQLNSFEAKHIFFLIVLLAAAAEIAATFTTIGQANFAYEVGTAVSVSAIPLYGPEAAALAVALSSLSFWLFNQRKSQRRKAKWLEQLLFNIGMHSIAIFCAGHLYFVLQEQVGTQGIFTNLLIWVITAVFYDQINLWLVIGMAWLVSSNPPNPFAFWRENLSAMFINIILLSIGGPLFTFAVEEFGWIGIVVFFIPIALSSFAFQLYVRQMQAHMDNLENIILERTEELQNLMAEKDAFLAVLTHDMKSPLTTIGIYAGLLDERPEILLERPRITSSLKYSQQTLLTIVNNILDIEKLNVEGGPTLEKEPFDLVMLIDAVTENLKAQGNQKDIDIAFCTQTQSIPVIADRHQIERVIQNLISNAVKYTNSGGHIDVIVNSDETHAVVDVIDDGYGIPADELPYIFDRFRRVDKHRAKSAGTGLGLAITKALVEAHGGEISVQSEEDKGSQFTIKLPLSSE